MSWKRTVPPKAAPVVPEVTDGGAWVVVDDAVSALADVIAHRSATTITTRRMI
jgi:hypothetical protein